MMKKLGNYFLMAAGIVMLTAIIAGISAGPAVAQLVKAALVRDIDHPARNFITIQLFRGFDEEYTVPAGKILVIEHLLTGTIQDTQTYILRMRHNGPVVNGTNTAPWEASFRHDFGTSDFSRNVRLYAKGGQTISHFVSNPNNLSITPLIVIGYLVDAN